MHPRPEDEPLARTERASAAPFGPARHGSRSERVREIRLRIADDAYRSDAVVEEIARRILMSREL
jgi:Anti-sigma-28 factor, FlgM